MKNLLIISLLFVAVPVLAGSAVNLQKKDNGKEIRVKEGAVIELSLEGRGGTGYVWDFDRLDEEHFELMKTETKPLAAKSRVGAPVLHTWWLRVKKAGASELRLSYFRPWEGRGQAVEHYRVKVRID